MLLKSPYTHPLCPAYQLRWTPWTSDGFFKTRHHPFKCVKLPAAPLNCRIQSPALCTQCEVEPFDTSFTDVLNEVFSNTQNNPDNLKPHRKNRVERGEGKKKSPSQCHWWGRSKGLALVANRTDQKQFHNCFPSVSRLSQGRSGRQLGDKSIPGMGSFPEEQIQLLQLWNRFCPTNMGGWEGRRGEELPVLVLLSSSQHISPQFTLANVARALQSWALPWASQSRVYSGMGCRWAVPAQSHLGKAVTTPKTQHQAHHTCHERSSSLRNTTSLWMSHPGSIRWAQQCSLEARPG